VLNVLSTKNPFLLCCLKRKNFLSSYAATIDIVNFFAFSDNLLNRKAQGSVNVQTVRVLLLQV
jgi:hypothetical protein